MQKNRKIYINLCDLHEIACRPYNYIVYPESPGPLATQLYRPDEFRLISGFCMADTMKAKIRKPDQKR